MAVGLLFSTSSIINNRSLDEDALYCGGLSGLLHKSQAIFFQRRIVVVIHVVEAYYCSGTHLFQQTNHKIRADKARAASNQDRFIIQIYLLNDYSLLGPA